MNYYLSVLKKYTEFSGRARRKEFWMFVLINYVISCILAVIDNAMGATIESCGILSTIYGLAVFLPSIALDVRRLHDINKSGWWLLLLFIPFIGWIWLIVLDCIAGTVGPNQYGEDPKAQGQE